MAPYTTRYRAMLERLRAARLAAGLTQVQVAKKLRKRQSWVSNCETGERRIDPIELEDFAKLYGKPVPFFLSGP